MSTTDTTTPDEAQAVVEDTAQLLQGATIGTAGALSPRELEENQFASAVISQYCLVDETGYMVPDLQITTAQLAEQRAARTGQHADDALEAIVQSMIDRRIRRTGWFGAVSLDIASSEPGYRPQDLGHPDAPAVLFYEVQPGSPHYRAESEPGKPAQRACAWWFRPEVDELGYAVNPRPGRTDPARLFSDDTWVAGYEGVLCFFGSHREAKLAMRDLRRAVMIAGTVPAPAPVDPVNAAHLDGVDADERALARNRQVPGRHAAEF